MILGIVNPRNLRRRKLLGILKEGERSKAALGAKFQRASELGR